jgi:hypothetical protein
MPPFESGEDVFTLLTPTQKPNIVLPLDMLREPIEVDEFPPEIFVTMSPADNSFRVRGLETKIITNLQHRRGRELRDRTILPILDLTDPESGVAVRPKLGEHIRRSSCLQTDELLIARRGLVENGCVTPIYPGPNKVLGQKNRVIVVHPRAIRDNIESGNLSVPPPEYIEKIERISKVARHATLLALAEALEI